MVFLEINFSLSTLCRDSDPLGLGIFLLPHLTFACAGSELALLRGLLNFEFICDL